MLKTIVTDCRSEQNEDYCRDYLLDKNAKYAYVNNKNVLYIYNYCILLNIAVGCIVIFMTLSLNFYIFILIYCVLM